jgi:membrane associated rhomboid family serine protease
MIPLRTSVTQQQVPWVNHALIVLNLTLFAYELALGPQVEHFVQTYGWIPANFSQAIEQGSFPALGSLLSCMFLHGGWAHLLGNMLYLYIFGGNVEDRLGHLRYLVFYCLGGVIAVLVQTYTNPASMLPMIGASGAIAAVTGAYFVFYPTTRVLTLLPLGFSFPVIRIPAVFYLILWLGLQVGAGMYTQTATTPRVVEIAWWAHVGGFVAGLLLGPLLLLKRRHPRRRRSSSSLAWPNPRSALRW